MSPPGPDDPALEAERSLIGALLLDGAPVADVVRIVSAADFAEPKHRHLFEAVSTLNDKGEPIDFVTVGNELNKAGRFAEAGGHAYMAELAQGITTTAHARHHARIVAEAARPRRAVQLLRRAAVAIEGEHSGRMPRLLSGLIGELQAVVAPALEVQSNGGATWPRLATDALYGLGGDFVRLVSPHSEADPVALLGQFLVEFGNCVGGGPCFVVEADRHYTNINLVLVGRTAKGRKGTSRGHVHRLFALADEDWSKDCEKQGLSSGEGLIWQVRDPIEKEEPIKEKGKVVGYQTVITDQGVADKRLLVVETEFAHCLRVLDRDGNTLSAVVRNAWDTGSLSTLTKNSPARATGAHVSIIGHITQDEALRYLDRTEAANGFGNRFLWMCVRRARVLPEGGKLSDKDLQDFAHKLRRAVEFGRTVREATRDADARELWIQIYAELSEGRPGLLGAMTARAEAQAMRLALLYALLDLSAVIRRDHLLAGLALWAYAEDSAAYVFGSSLGDPAADEILRALRASKGGLTRTQIRDLFQKNRGKDEIGRALAVLLTHGLARFEQGEKEGPGRKAEVWLAVAGRPDGGGIRSWRSFLSYPGSTDEHPQAPSEGTRGGTTKTTESTATEQNGQETQAAQEAEAAHATTKTTDTTESNQAEVAVPGTPTYETTKTTEFEADVPAAAGSRAFEGGSASQEESEWSTTV